MKTLYPCQYPDCPARYDPDLDGATEDGPGSTIRLNGWVYPWDAEAREDVGTHDHILNILVTVEIDEDEAPAAKPKRPLGG